MIPLISKCTSLVFPQHEDYGITPLEANASGRPVIAYGKGGVLETMIPYNGASNDYTAVFFKEQTKESLIGAITKFQTLEVNSEFIKNRALKSDKPVFIEKILNFVTSKIDKLSNRELIKKSGAYPLDRKIYYA